LGCSAGPKNKRLKEMNWEQRRKEVPFEGGQGPEGVVALYMNGWVGAWMVPVSTQQYLQTLKKLKQQIQRVWQKQEDVLSPNAT
jgi:hypothetical protein